ncbi:MAG: uroporphyrinogen-III synthase [Acidobacteriota bacterium]
MSQLTLGTRGTPLALAQAHYVAALFEQQGIEVHLEIVVSQGDRSLGGSLAQAKGMFTADLTEGLLRGTIDVAVHSLKDLPVDDEPGLVIAAIPERAPANDVLLVREGSVAHDLLDEARPEDDGRRSVAALFDALPERAKLGTSSPRRQALALARRPDLLCVAVRGAVGTRLDRLRQGAVDTLLLAKAGLDRLVEAEPESDLLADIVAYRLSLDEWPCAPGQGALAVQVARDGEWNEHEALRALDDATTRTAVELERNLLQSLGGGCQMPLAAWSPEGRQLVVRLATEDWRSSSSALSAPHFARWPRSLEGETAIGDLDAITGSLRQQLGRAAPGPESADARFDLFVTGRFASIARLTRGLPGSVGARGTSLTEPVEPGDAAWPVEDVRLEGPRGSWPWVLVSSPTAARVLVRRLETEPIWGRLPWCALGDGTARELLGLGVPASLVADAREGSEFARFVIEALQPAQELFVPQSARSAGRLTETLRAAGRTVHAFPAYTVVPKSALEGVEPWPPDAVLFTSPSQVEAAAELGLETPPELWALGEPTRGALEMAYPGAPIHVAETPDARGIAALWISRTPDSRTDFT